MKAKDDPELKALLNRAEFQIPDGIGVIIASKLQKGNITSRVTGVDMMDRIVREAARTQKSIFLYGAKPGSRRQSGRKTDRDLSGSHRRRHTRRLRKRQQQSD